jgi:hypothetical protein
MKGYIKKLRKIESILGRTDNHKKPYVLNDVNLEEFQVKMGEFIENYTYFNQDRNVVKAAEILSEMFLYILLTANKQGLHEVFDKVTNLVCDDIIDGTQQDEENGHRIPIVTQGNHKVINLDTNKNETFSAHIDAVIFKAMGYKENEDLRF